MQSIQPAQLEPPIFITLINKCEVAVQLGYTENAELEIYLKYDIANENYKNTSISKY